MHIGEIITNDSANGPGIRLSIFVSGCTNHCKGCFQPETWDFTYGKEYTKEIEDYLIKELSKPQYQGLTILGGEPLEPSNQEGLLPLILRINKELPEKDIWVFTGFTLETDLCKDGRKYTSFTKEFLNNIDVLVDGRFVEELKNIRLRFRGSENQRIIDMKRSIKYNNLVFSSYQY